MSASKVGTMNESGAIMLPKSLRNILKANKFIVNFENKEIRLKPVPAWREVFGSMKNINLEKFKKQHEEDLLR